MASENLHVPRDKLSKSTIQLHYAISSLMEELEAVESIMVLPVRTRDWIRLILVCPSGTEFL